MSAQRQQTDPTPETSSIANLANFFDRLNAFHYDEAKQLPLIGSFLDRFAAEQGKLVEEEKKWEQFHAPNFNPFRLLRLDRMEAKLHTPFIAHLLDPQAAHGQQDLFLKQFFQMAKEARLDPPKPFPRPCDWQVTPEFHLDGSGRADIVLRSSNSFIMIIENKIDDDEQEDQMKRYAEWINDQHTDHSHLVFLTLHGGPPDYTGPCICLSYDCHIKPWLQSALEQIQAPSVRFAVQQYLQIIKSL